MTSWSPAARSGDTVTLQFESKKLQGTSDDKQISSAHILTLCKPWSRDLFVEISVGVFFAKKHLTSLTRLDFTFDMVDKC